jgi:hypothetical protein
MMANMNASMRKTSIVQDIKGYTNTVCNTSRRRLTNSIMNCRSKGREILAYNKCMHIDSIPLSFIAGSALA